MQELKVSYCKDLQQLKDVHKLEEDKTLLESERRILETTQTVKDEYGHRIDAILVKNDAFRTKNQELTEKIFSLELERLRKEDHLRS